MLQFITKGCSRYSIEDEVRMVIEGGCRWIQISAESVGNSFTSLKEVAEAVIPLCRENDCFLVIDNDVELVDELRVHGVFLNDSSRGTVMAVRNRLGGNAVIGVQGKSVEEIAALRGLDVDYVSIPVEVAEGALNALQAEDGAAASSDIVEGYRRIAEALNEARVDFHLVAQGNFTPVQMQGILRAGFAGIAVSSEILDAQSPAAFTSELISTLEDAR